MAFDPSLQAIADILGMPVQTFFDDAPTGRLIRASECLKLWLDIESEEGRRQALDTLRDIARDEQGLREARSD